MVILMATACGIDDYPYLESISSGNVAMTFSDRAIVYLNNPNPLYFRRFSIYYRIYVSDISLTTINTGNMQSVNPSLYSDYTYFDQYITSTSRMNTNFDNLFRQRNFRLLALEGADIESYLDSGAVGGTLVIEFPTSDGSIPFMNLSGNPNRILLRNNIGFSPRPTDRRFSNTPDLYLDDNLTNTINADVANKSGIPPSPRHTYASMYILAAGVNTANSSYAPIYSVPTFIGVFRLPD
ncbi:hypothetical protein AGMMS49928_01720 [Spirochaetia bacterium]|nr:hypothetical protein AGMMS49928_01720 [Spirochaetia bacterium]